jgi:transcriptional regulator GlxA family with amidase domain
MPEVCLRDMRIEQAKALLRGKPISNTKIAALCGFLSAEHFIREFEAKLGVTPATWRAYVLN